MEYLTQYLDYLSFERRLSPLTRENYARDLNLLIELADKTPLETLKTNHIRRFIANMHSRDLSGKSIARALSAWRGLFHYLCKKHDFSHNPCIGLRAPKSPKSLPQALSIDQVVHFVDIKEDDILSLRDHAILELFYSSGLRLAELASLNTTDFSMQEGIVTVTGKGNKTRIVPVGEQALKALQKWLVARASLVLQEESQHAIFVTQQGKRISHRAIQYRLKTWAVKQGINVNVHPHMLRHSFASHVLQSSGDLRAVQEMLGHANISTTQVYTHLDFQHLAKVYDAAHPRARKK